MTDLPVIAGQLLEGQRVILADAQYIDCVIRHCQIVYDGRPVTVPGCDMIDNDWEIAGAAALTIDFLKTLWEMGADKTVAKVIGKIVSRDPKEVHALFQP